MNQIESILIDEIDVSSPSLFENDIWAPYFKRLRQERPIHFCPESPYGPYWSITRFNDIQTVELDYLTFSSDSTLGGIRIDNRLKESFISSDPPRHTLERKTIAPVASPTNLARYEPIIRERTRRLIASLPRNETFDWVEKVSSELTVMMLATLFDFPLEKRHDLALWSDALICDFSAPDARVKSDSERNIILYQMASTFTKLWRERVAQNPKIDLISMMAHNQAMSDLSEAQYIGNLVLLLVGGYDTTKNSMSGGILALSKNPDQWDLLKADPSLVPNLVSEIIRFQTPIIHMCRTTTRDVELNGQHISAGDRVVLWYVSANRDESVIDSPEEFMINRLKPQKHLSFGAGIHRCVGDRLATLQLRVLWEEILAQNLSIEVAGPPTRQYSNFIRGICHLPTRICT
jgi:cytochrome P450